AAGLDRHERCATALATAAALLVDPEDPAVRAERRPDDLAACLARDPCAGGPRDGRERDAGVAAGWRLRGEPNEIVPTLVRERPPAGRSALAARNEDRRAIRTPYRVDVVARFLRDFHGLTTGCRDLPHLAARGVVERHEGERSTVRAPGGRVLEVVEGR